MMINPQPRHCGCPFRVGMVYYAPIQFAVSPVVGQESLLRHAGVEIVTICETE
jgi:hypothetical protein